MRFILEKILKILAKLILRRHRPVVAAVTGSVGKTTTKEAIACVLRRRFRVRQSRKNYNTEIGLPLAILDDESGGRFPGRWAAVFWRAAKLIIWGDKNYPEILVLEMGADRPGDIEKLCAIAHPDIGVVTAIGEMPVHVEFFSDINALIEEKSTLVKKINPRGAALLNYDDLSVRMMRDDVLPGRQIITYGFGEGAKLKASDFFIEIEEGKPVVHFKVSYQGSVVPVRLNNVLGRHHVYAVLAAIGAGIVLRMNLVEIASALQNYNSSPGRLRPLAGIKGTTIIDDTYNSSPLAAMEALETLALYPGRKIAALGDMTELGRFTEQAHREVGEKAARICDFLITVGERSRFIANEARKQGMPQENIIEFDEAPAAALALQRALLAGDTVLIKGSQIMRMEKIIEEVMANPERAGELLIRQEEEWK